MRSRSGLGVAVAVLTAVLLSGCAGVRIYEEARDKKGQAAVKAWADADLPGYFKASRDAEQKALQAELETEDLLAAQRTESTLRALLGDSVGQLAALIAKQMEGLLGSGDPAVFRPCPAAPGQAADPAGRSCLVQELLARHAALDQVARDKAFVRGLLLQRKQPDYSCDAARKEVAAPKDFVVAAILGQLVIACDKEAAATSGGRNFGSGGLQAAYASLDQARAELNGAKAAVDAQAIEVQKARAKLDVAVAGNKAGDKPSAEVKLAAEDLRKAIKALEGVGGALGRKAYADETLKSLDEVLAFAVSGDPPAKDAGHRELVAQLIPKLGDDVQALRDLSRRVPTQPLLLHRNIAQNRADALQVEIDFQTQRITLLQRRAAVLEGQVTDLAIAYGDIRAFPDPAMSLVAAAGPPAKSIKGVKADLGPGDERRRIYTAAAWYLDVVGRQQARADQADDQLQSLQRQYEINRSEAAVNQWVTLVAAVTQQSADYAAGGFKASDFKDLIQTVTLIWIGKGANK